jgi:hypothetical protein
MRHLCIALAFTVTTACGKSGRPDYVEDPQIPIPSPTPSQADESLYTSVRLGLLNRPIDEDVKCSGVRSGIKLADVSAVNGQISWDDSMLVIDRAESDSQHNLRQLSLAFDEASGFYGKLVLRQAGQLSDEKMIRINFGVVTGEEGADPTAVYKRSLLIKNNQIVWLDHHEKEQAIANAAIAIQDDTVFFAVPSEIMEGIVFYPFWYVEASHIANGRMVERTGVRFVESPRSHSNYIKVSECHPINAEADEPVIQLLSRTTLQDVEVRRRLGIARRSWVQISSEIGQKQSPVASVAMMIAEGGREEKLIKTLHNWTMNKEFIIKLQSFDTPASTTSPIWNRHSEYAQIAQIFANINLLDPAKINDRNLSTLLVLANSIAVQDIQRSIGTDAQFRFAWSDLRLFAEDSDLNGEKLSISEFPPESLLAEQKRFSKLLGLSEMLATILSPFDLIGVKDRFADLPEEAQTLQEAAEILGQAIRKSKPSFPNDGLSGWISADSYHTTWTPENLVDIDSDGLNGFVEYSNNSSPLLGDSDSDGWSDSSEYIQGASASDSTNHPDMIFADGEFGDWRFLLPNKVALDPDHSSSACLGEANIVHYSGIHDSSRVIVMANQERQSQIDFTWQAFFEFIVDGETLALDATLKPGEVTWRWNKVGGNQPNPVFMSVTPFSKKTLELELRLRDILSEQEVEKLQQIRFRVKTAFKNEACDDSQWVKLLKYQNN